MEATIFGNVPSLWTQFSSQGKVCDSVLKSGKFSRIFFYKLFVCGKQSEFCDDGLGKGDKKCELRKESVSKA